VNKMRFTFFLFSIFLYLNAFGQIDSELVKDIDGDNISDTIRLDSVRSCIVCQLSSEDFTPIYSPEIYLENMNGMGSSLSGIEKGFSYQFNWMRAGESVDFQYEKSTKKIRVTGMHTYAFGNAAGDGKNDLDFDLLDGRCSGVMCHFDYVSEELIYVDIDFPIAVLPMYLEDFDTGLVLEAFEKALTLARNTPAEEE